MNNSRWEFMIQHVIWGMDKWSHSSFLKWLIIHTIDSCFAHTSWCMNGLHSNALTHWGRVTHICVSKQTIIGSDNGLSPGRRQAIIWTNAGILLIGPLGTNFSEILIEIYLFSFKKMHLKMSSGNWQPFCLGLNVLSTMSMAITSSLT